MNTKDYIVESMIKDGRRYLVLCNWNTNTPPSWEIIHWGVPTGLSDPAGRIGWVNQIGFALRTEKCVFSEYYELDSAVQLLRCTKMAGIDYGKKSS